MPVQEYRTYEHLTPDDLNGDILVTNTSGEFAGEIQPLDDFREESRRLIPLRKEVIKLEFKCKELKDKLLDLNLEKRKTREFYDLRDELRIALDILINTERKVLKKPI